MPQAKRKRYDAAYYALMLDELTKTMDQVPKLRADREAWDIEGDWADTGTIYFVDADFQPMFARFADFDCRSIKIVNFGRPAVRMSFFKEHKFWVLKDKDLTKEEKMDRIQVYMNELGAKADRLLSKLPKLSGLELTQAKSDIALWQSEQTVWKEVLLNVDAIEMSISNYERVHKYVTMNYKYILNEEGDFANQQEHMLNPQKDRTGTINQPRYNLIFVDTDHIRRDHPYQSKQIDKYLGRFSVKSQAGRYTLYARLRPEGDSVTRFELQTGTDLSIPVSPLVNDEKRPSSRKRQKPKPTPLFDQQT